METVGTVIGCIAAVVGLITAILELRKHREAAEIGKEATEESRGRDKTKYSIDDSGKLYGKGRLVLAVVKVFVERNQNVSAKGLRNVFPDEWHGWYVVRSISDDIWKDKKKREKDFFCKEDELIHLHDGDTIAVCRQWGIANIGKFLDGARTLGFKIKEYPQN